MSCFCSSPVRLFFSPSHSHILHSLFFPHYRTTALDHTRILGSTVEAIGRNKAGIFKAGRPALVGPGVPLSTIQVLLHKS